MTCRCAIERVWLGDRPVDVIYRIFMIEDLLHPDGPALINPVLQAAERGEVKIFTPMHSQLYSSKGALALLSDEANRHLCTPGELASLDRLLPWTRMLRAGPVTVDGERVDLLQVRAGRREQLIVKPTARHGGLGILAGWLADDREWERQLRARLGQPFVLQRRVRPEPELFPGEGGLEPWVLTWGAYLCGRGYGGMWVRGTADRDTGGVNMATGAYATCCFTEAPAAGAASPGGGCSTAGLRGGGRARGFPAGLAAGAAARPRVELWTGRTGSRPGRDATAASGGAVRAYDALPAQRELAIASLAELLGSPVLRDWSRYRETGFAYLRAGRRPASRRNWPRSSASCPDRRS